MPRSKVKGRGKVRRPKHDPQHGSEAGKQTSEPLPESDIPDPQTIIARIPFTSPTGKRFTIIRTNETDPDDEGEPKP
ncbi:MAG TPA: hypothetical protein VF723_12415 [Pyrinomonadaceae bacterium]|jgi:hypothetical protein